MPEFSRTAPTEADRTPPPQPSFIYIRCSKCFFVAVNECHNGVMTQRTVVQIRSFETGDTDAVMTLAPRLTEWVAPWREPAAVLQAVQGWVRASIDTADQDDHAFYVAIADDQVVGLVTACERAHFTGQVDAYVGELVVSPAWERRGVATRLMKAAENWAAGRGLPFITLGTGPANQPACGLYASLGYREELVELTRPVTQPS